MIKLNPEAEKILRRFADRPFLSRESRQKYREIELAYGRFLRLFFLSIQDNLDCLCDENLDDINLIISWTYESLYWARRSLSSQSPPTSYKTVNYAISVDRNKNVLSESYDLLFFRLTSHCPQGLLLDNSLIRLGQAHELAIEVTRMTNAIVATRMKRKSIRGENK